MVNVLESTLEWAQGEVIVNSCIGFHTPSFSLDSASVLCVWQLIELELLGEGVIVYVREFTSQLISQAT